MQERQLVKIDNSPDQLKVTISNTGSQFNEPQREVDEEQLKTLWVGGLNEKVDEEILYELFQNAGPLESVKIPKDRETKKQKNFGFIMFQHSVSVKYAYDLFNSVELYGQRLRLQNKETGLGLGNGTSFRGHSRSTTMPNLHMSNGGRRDERRDRGRDDSQGVGMQDDMMRTGMNGMMRQSSFGGSGYGMGGGQIGGYPMGYAANGYDPYEAQQVGQNGGQRRQDRGERDYGRESYRDRSYDSHRDRSYDKRDDRRRQY